MLPPGDTVNVPLSGPVNRSDTPSAEPEVRVTTALPELITREVGGSMPKVTLEWVSVHVPRAVLCTELDPLTTLVPAAERVKLSEVEVKVERSDDESVSTDAVIVPVTVVPLIVQP